MEEKVYALVLAGGKSSRMGTDKAKLEIAGKTMLEHAVEFWKTSGKVSEVYVSVGSIDHFEELPEGAEEIPDILESMGPMAGIWSAFKITGADVLYVSAVDMPNITHDMILPLTEGDAGAYLKNGKPEPLFAFYRRSTMDVMEELLWEGKNRMTILFRHVKTDFTEVPEGRENAFDNVNTPDEFELALKK